MKYWQNERFAGVDGPPRLRGDFPEGAREPGHDLWAQVQLGPIRSAWYLPEGAREVVHDESDAEEELEAPHRRRAQVEGVLDLAVEGQGKRCCLASGL
jgi:hypothetical protein